MTDDQRADAPTESWKPGDRVTVGSVCESRPVVGRRRQPQAGTVVAVDNGPRPGVTVSLDDGRECYATHDELERIGDE